MSTIQATDRERIEALILYISEKCARDPKFSKTKLNKLLFYSDSVALGVLGRPITEWRYVKDRYGPVPEDYSLILDDMVEARRLKIERDQAVEAQQVPIARVPVPEGLLTPAQTHIEPESHLSPEGPRNPHCRFEAVPGEHPSQIMRRAIAGVMAEIHVLGRTTMTRGSGFDRVQFNHVLGDLADSAEEQDLLVRELCVEMSKAFRIPDVQAAVHAIAGALLQRRRLNDAELRRIADAAGLRTTLPLTPRTHERLTTPNA